MPTLGETSDLFDDNGKWIGVLDRNGREQVVLTEAQQQAVQALTGNPKEILDAAAAGASSAWFPYVPGMRLAWQLDSGTTSTTFSIDISADGVTSLGQAYTGVWASSTVAEISPPLYLTNPLARYLRFNVLSGGPLSVNRSI